MQQMFFSLSTLLQFLQGLVVMQRLFAADILAAVVGFILIPSDVIISSLAPLQFRDSNLRQHSAILELLLVRLV